MKNKRQKKKKTTTTRKKDNRKNLRAQDFCYKHKLRNSVYDQRL